MSDVSTAQSGSIKCNASATTSAPNAATVTLTANASCALRDRNGADRRFTRAIIRAIPGVLQESLINDIRHGCRPPPNSGLPEFGNIIVQVGNSRLGCRLKPRFSTLTLSITARKHDGPG